MNGWLCHIRINCFSVLDSCYHVNSAEKAKLNMSLTLNYSASRLVRAILKNNNILRKKIKNELNSKHDYCIFGSVFLPQVCPWRSTLAILLAGGQCTNRPFLTSPDSLACDFINNATAWQALPRRRCHAKRIPTKNPQLNSDP